MKDILKNKGKGWFICTAAAILAAVVAVIVLSTYKTVLPNSLNGTDIAIALFATVAVQVIVTLVPMKFAALLSVIGYSVAFGFVINKIPAAIVDFINGIFYNGGSFSGCMLYGCSTLLMVILAIVACFLPQTTNNSEKI